MSNLTQRRRRIGNTLARRSSLLLAAALLISSLSLTFASSPALAQGGIGISGSFYQQKFQIPQGSSVGGQSIDVVVFNTGNASLRVKMTTQVPAGVNMTLSQNDFTIKAGGQQQVLVGLEVSKSAVPGEYEVGISAESFADTGAGIHLAGSAQQTAKLIVLGDSGMVSVQAKSPDGKPITATVRLYRIVGGQNFEVTSSENGSVNIKVAPGNFTAVSYIGGLKVAEEPFSIANGDSKSIILSGATVYFEDFGAVPNYQKDDGSLAFVKLVYTVRNLSQKVDKAEVILTVSYNGSPPQEELLATLSPLETGSAGLNYNYTPAGGWRSGTYKLKLQLNLNGKPYAYTQEQQINVTENISDSSIPGSRGVSLPVIIGGAVAAVAVVVIVITFLLRKKR